MEVSARLSSKGQVTVPRAVREALSLEEGDRLVFRVEGDHAPCSRGRRISSPWRDRSACRRRSGARPGRRSCARRGGPGPPSAGDGIRRHQRPGPTPHRRSARDGCAGDSLPRDRRRTAAAGPDPRRGGLRPRVLLRGAPGAGGDDAPGRAGVSRDPRGRRRPAPAGRRGLRGPPARLRRRLPGRQRGTDRDRRHRVVRSEHRSESRRSAARSRADQIGGRELPRSGDYPPPVASRWSPRSPARPLRTVGGQRRGRCPRG